MMLGMGSFASILQLVNAFLRFTQIQNDFIFQGKCHTHLNKMSYHDFLDTDGCHLGDYREPTDKEWEEDRAQAIADNREYAC